MTVTPMKTKAEQQLAQQFASVAPQLPGGGWVAQARAAALDRVVAAGLPSRRVEEWKYTDLKARMSEALVPASGSPRTLDTKALADALGPELFALDAPRLVFVDGLLARGGGLAEPIAGVHVEQLAANVGAKGFDWMKPHLVRQGGELPDTIVALNTAFASDGALIRIEAGAKLEKPLHLVFLSSPGASAQVAVRNLIEVGAGASATLIESHVAAGGSARQSNAVTELAVKDGADVRHLKLTAEGAKAQHLSRWDVTLGRDAIYRAFQMVVGTALVRNELLVTFAGEGGNFELAALTLGRGGEHADTTLVVDHKVPHCISREHYKTVLEDHARAVFQGKVIVRPDAQKTDGKQMAQALMLSPDAEFDSKPELEIYADDVVCGHGSTVAELDEDLLFYCRSRGIPERQARALLIESFIGEVLDKVEHEAMREALTALAARWMAGGGA